MSGVCVTSNEGMLLLIRESHLLPLSEEEQSVLQRKRSIFFRSFLQSKRTALSVASVDPLTYRMMKSVLIRCLQQIYRVSGRKIQTRRGAVSRDSIMYLSMK